MRNRIAKYIVKKGDRMEHRNIANVDDLKLVTEDADGFAIGISILNKGEIQHYLLTRDFPLLDLLKSWAKVKGLMISQLESDSQRDF